MRGKGIRSISRRDLLRASAIAAAAGPMARAARLRILPRLTVWIVAEQFRGDYLSRAAAFPGGGFRKLLDEGAHFPDCRTLSSTFTATGLATLATGAWASTHGVVGERWYDPATKEVRVATAALLAAPTLFESAPPTRLFCIEQTPGRAALLTGWREAMTFRRDGNGFRASAAGHEWLDEFNATHSSERLRDQGWQAQGAAEGAPPMRVLKYDQARADQFGDLLLASPFEQADEFALLSELVRKEKLGAGSATRDVVMLVLEPLGKLALETGADSPLMDDMVAKLDRQIAGMLEVLAARVGEGNYQVVFSAAHGATGASSKDLHVDAPRVADAIETALALEFGKGRPAGERYVEAYVYPFVYLRAQRIPQADLARARVLAGRAAMAAAQVSGYLTADGACSRTDDWAVRMRNSFYPGRSGDAMLLYPPGFVEAFAGSRGISFGSLYNYDAQSPVCFYGPAFRAGRFEGTIEATSIAPTIAASLGWPLPAQATGRVLGEAFGEGREVN